MDLSVYYRPLLRMWWLLVAATLTAAISTSLMVFGQPDAYESKTTLMIGQIIDNPNPTSGDLYLIQQLASAYADIANRNPIQESTKQALGLEFLPTYLARALPDNTLIEIVVTDSIPTRAQVVANELARQLILRSPAGELSTDPVRGGFINQQVNDIQTQIVDTQNEITRLQEELGGINSASELQNTQNQITAQQQKLTTLQGIYANLILNTQQGATNTLVVVEPAELPTVPVGPNKLISVLIAAGIGFLLAAGAALLFDYLDDTLKIPEDVERLLGLPVIGFISEIEDPENGRNGVYISKHPRSPVAEAYRSLRANLDFLGRDKPLKSILITSANTSAGKTSTSANLATVIAQAGKKVYLVDADLRKPKIHEYFGLFNTYGLTETLLNGMNIDEAVTVLESEKFSVITSGHTFTNPAELLASERMDQVLAKLNEVADVVILDSPPMVVVDALYLAAKVDGVLIVIQPGHTRKRIISAMLDQLNRSGARILGVVFNRIPLKGAESYGGYSYYSPYYSDGHYSEDSDGIENAGVENQIKRYWGNLQARISKSRNKTES